MINGNVKKIKLKEGYEVYTRSVGKGKLPILLLHGGPGGCHECFEAMEKYMDLEKYTLIYYDQLGSYYSDPVEDDSLLTLERYVDEVEQVRAGLGLEYFALLGHSWGGMLAIEYALKYQNYGYLKGVIISNMTASNDSYEKGLSEVRKDMLEPEELAYIEAIEAKEDYDDKRYQEIIFQKLYPQCIFRGEEWPAFFAPEKMAHNVYNKFQGNNEFIVTGTLKSWDRWDDLKDISVKTMIIGAKYDTMSAKDKEEMASRIPNAELLICPKGSHFAFLDDVENYYPRLQKFLETI
ncbi:proline iminopeptidase-family hydrolase [Clostridiaceae bacterium M8S5]|nr:proline iminopeptidase-family hydrolase [Clostridiaceae bacterium M8S5]